MHEHPFLRRVMRIGRMVVASLVAAPFLVGVSAGIAAQGGGEFALVAPAPDADLAALGMRLRGQGCTYVNLLPEGRILIRTGAAGAAPLGALPGVASVEPFAPAADAARDAEPSGRGLGERPPTPAEQEAIDRGMQQAPAPLPNDLSRRRALLEGRDTLPALVDNSLSQYFPPIRSQGSQGSCTCWAACYYYNTYLQAQDESLVASGGNNDVICSPAFMYPLLNDGEDNGASTSYAMIRLGDMGCCSWTQKPYSASDWTTWPSEANWIEAFQRRTQSSYTMTVSTADQMTALKQFLANGNIAATRTTVYSNWYNNYPSNTTGINNAVLFANSGDNVGGHAMTIVGYDDNKSYNDGTGTKYGAFLIANSWGTWGTYNTGGVKRGYMWVAYDFFRGTAGCFGVAYYNSDRDNYRTKLYAVAGLNHAERGRVMFRGGAGATADPDWTSAAPINYDGGTALSITDAKRVAVDLNDGIPYLADFTNVQLFVEMKVSTQASAAGTITSAVFYHDLDGNHSFSPVSSTDPTVTVSPGTASGYAATSFVGDLLRFSPGTQIAFDGPHGGPFTSADSAYTITNTGAGAANWTAAPLESVFSLSKTGGAIAAGASDSFTVSASADVNLLAPGSYTSAVTMTNSATGVTQTRRASIVVRPASNLAVAAVPSPQIAGIPFSVSIAAKDSQSLNCPGFTGPVNVSAFAGSIRTAGTGTSTWYEPLGTYYHDSRTQAIYLASELGGAGTFSRLALDVTTAPPQTLNNWTIRMKHTTLAAFASATWESTGWTTVYQANESIASTGWHTFVFTTPFVYDGVSNLMIDFSFNNDNYSSNGYVRRSSGATGRSVYYQTDSSYEDPLTWSGSTPSGYRSSYYPNLLLMCGQGCTVSPTSSDTFSDGAWTGDVTVATPASSVVLLVSDGTGLSGMSNSFTVNAPPVAAAGDWQLFN